MYKAILLSIGSPTTLGIYYEETSQKVTSIKEPKLIFILRIDGKTSDVLPLLFVSHNLDKKTTYKSLESLLTPEVLSKCSLAECLIDSSFLQENKGIKHVLKTLDIKDSIDSIYSNQTNSANRPNCIDKGANLENLDTKHNIYFNEKIDSKTQIDFIQLNCSLSKALHLLSYFMPLNAIYYSRGVGSLSAIKLTHVFLHTLSLSSEIKLYATNSFYFSQANEIKAFANMSFYLKPDSKHIVITDSNAKEYIHIAPSSINDNLDLSTLFLPYRLIHNDFLESCTPLYVTPAV
ncbi:hypothetical protein [Helicobacter bilis]|uniref:Uncharacterized protein n=1 Tax=Helicobacter bilis TaxID=37372 RepID=A0A4U8U9A4_9HELI|nr:hypothetical protein [Helicobacter bilis]TLE10328.1 hypothetical protein LS79_006405 [Helicobacter bilis]